MKLLITPLIITSALLLSSCSSPITYNVRFDNVTFDNTKRKTVISAINLNDRTEISDLTNEIMALGKGIDKKEAAFVARESILFPKHLANEYRLIGPPNSQNQLVNTGKRERGLCYHFARDMTDHIVKDRTFKTLTLQRAVANQGKGTEHNVLTVAAKDKGISDSIILDAWRESSNLYWLKASEDPNYDWTKYSPRVYVQKSDNKRQLVSYKEDATKRTFKR